MRCRNPNVVSAHDTQVAALVAALAVEYVLSPQSVHAGAVPIAVLYFPATHAAHANPSLTALLYPAIHRQATKADEPDTADVNAGHVVQTESGFAVATE